MSHLRSRTIVPLLTTALALPAQTLESGYTATVRPLPPAVSAPLVLDRQGTVVYFTGTELRLDDGRSVRTLLALPAPTFGSFTIRVGPGELLFGESGQGDLWLVPLAATATPRRLANLPFNYDAVPWLDRALVSAKSGGFGSPDNEIVAVDLRTGATDVVARVPGASGPLAADATSVYYATASNSFPAPPGSTAILQFGDLLLLGGLGPAVLGPRDAALVAAGLDAASALAIDADGDLFTADFIRGAVLEVSRGGGTAQRVSTLASYAATDPQPGRLQFVPGPPAPAPRGLFEPFQPPSAELLVIHEQDFASGASRLREVATARPVLAVTPGARVDPGPFTLALTGAPAGGTALIAYGLGGAVNELPLAIAGFEQPIFWDVSLFAAVESIPVVIDARGSAAVTLVNPGLAFPLRFGAQAAFVDTAGAIVGSSGALRFEVR
ncbi:MAG: hypothetical protein IPM29_25185 [Planctomycetes bacterium]|nr:hypothetical protein [Planctomycetota bacterium]